MDLGLLKLALLLRERTGNPAISVQYNFTLDRIEIVAQERLLVWPPRDDRLERAKVQCREKVNDIKKALGVDPETGIGSYLHSRSGKFGSLAWLDFTHGGYQSRREPKGLEEHIDSITHIQVIVFDAKSDIVTCECALLDTKVLFTK
jgi:hypothetical protein